MRSANLYEVDLKITAWLEDFTVTEGLCEEEVPRRRLFEVADDLSF